MLFSVHVSHLIITLCKPILVRVICYIFTIRIPVFGTAAVVKENNIVVDEAIVWYKAVKLKAVLLALPFCAIPYRFAEKRFLDPQKLCRPMQAAYNGVASIKSSGLT